eukprot:gene11034-12199_t
MAEIPDPEHGANAALTKEEPPPNYTDTNEAPADAPPTYSSLYGELKAAKEESSGTLDLIQKVTALIFGTIGFIICMALFLAIPIASIVIGAKGLNKCTIEKYIPIYLVVMGAFGLLRNLMTLCGKGKERHQKDRGEDVDEPGKGRRGCEGVIDCFIFAWFICGNVWIYKNYVPNYGDVNSPQYCDQTLYLFAFWLTTATYIVMGAVCVCGCCIAVCAAAFS